MSQKEYMIWLTGTEGREDSLRSLLVRRVRSVAGGTKAQFRGQIIKHQGRIVKHGGYSEQSEKASFSVDGVILSNDEVCRVVVRGVGGKNIGMPR